MFSVILDLLFPPRCIHCLAYVPKEKALCERCRETVTIERTLFCGACRNRLPPSTGGGQAASICHPQFPYLLGAATRYAEPVPRELVLALKFRHVRAAAHELAGFLNAYLLTTHYPLPTSSAVIVPIPLGPSRARTRGYNQAELIAREVADQLALPLRTDILRRTRNTKPQSEARDETVRRANIAGAFRADPQRLLGLQTVILLDDVVTSGATLKEAALALKTASPGLAVIALAAARAQ